MVAEDGTQLLLPPPLPLAVPTAADAAAGGGQLSGSGEFSIPMQVEMAWPVVGGHQPT